MGCANLIDGRSVAQQVHTETLQRIGHLKDRGVQPGLAFVRVGDDPASKVYVGMKEQACQRLGILSETHLLPGTASLPQILDLLRTLNQNDLIHGILVQAPLPSHIPHPSVYAAVLPSKDVDGFNPVNAGKLILDDPSGFVPCTPAGIHRLLIHYQVNTQGAEAVILGRGDIVGKPMASILCQKHRQANATVTLCHSQTRHIHTHCRRADLLIAAMGVKEFVQADMVKPGAVVIDVGVNRVPDPQAKHGYRLVGDVAFAAVQPIARLITPNPGGVGPMTIAMLMQNTVRAAETATQ